jgi:hypothetical protein
MTGCSTSTAGTNSYRVSVSGNHRITRCGSESTSAAATTETTAATSPTYYKVIY